MVFKQGKELVGVEVDMASLLDPDLGRPVVFVEVPWKDQLEALNDQRTDIIMSSMSVTNSHRFVLNFPQPFFLVVQIAPLASVNMFVTQARQNGTFLKVFQRWTPGGN